MLVSIAFLNDMTPEQNYCVTRKELLAVVKSIKYFHKYLYGQKFVLKTDQDPEGQVARWIQQLQEYNFQIQYRKEMPMDN